MTRGSKTPDDIEAKFRAKYLLSGNAAAAAREVGIADGTGYDLAKKAQANPSFQEARAALYAQALGDVELMMLEVVQIARQRVEDSNELDMQDPRPQYAAQVVGAYKALMVHRKIQAELERDAKEQPAQVIVNIKTKESEVDVDAHDRSGAEPSTE